MTISGIGAAKIAEPDFSKAGKVAFKDEEDARIAACIAVCNGWVTHKRPSQTISKQLPNGDILKMTDEGQWVVEWWCQ